MTPAELKLAAYLLDLAADEFSNHGCNDLTFADAGLSEAEGRELHELLEADQEPHERNPYDGFGSDWHAMNVLAARLKAEAKRDS